MDSKVLVNNIKGSFLRDELNDSLLIVPQGCSYNEALIINRIGNEILRVSDGKNSLGEITRILSKRYRQVPMAKVLNDVNSFTNQMLKLNMLKLKEEPKVYNGKQVSTIGDLSVHRCGEGDFKRITNILNNESNIFDFVTSTAKKEDYNPLTIRARLFNFLEEYYILHGNDEDLALLTILNGRHVPTNIGAVGRFKQIKEMPNQVVIQFIQDSLRNFFQDIEPNCHKIRLSWIGSGQNIEGEVGSLFDKAGFKVVAVLENEFGNGKNQMILDCLSA